jgi:nitric oxide synthase-interacting protein
MTRKSKQPGGHNPLTAHERKKLLGDYGTQTARLGTASQRRFGDCALSLVPAVDPVCTPSGTVYSREAILSYLLTKTTELREARSRREGELAEEERKVAARVADEEQRAAREFVRKDQGAAQAGVRHHAASLEAKVGKKISTESTEEGKEGLKRTSYWLSEYSPGGDNKNEAGDGTNKVREPIPDRPPSPMTGAPLRRKDLISIELSRAEGPSGNVTCAVSGKAITAQRAIAIKKTGVVILEDVYEKLVKPDMACPVTGRKFKEKDVIRLAKAGSGYAGGGVTVEAKRYKPTLT